jgi:hypothetical protein
METPEFFNPKEQSVADKLLDQIDRAGTANLHALNLTDLCQAYAALSSAASTRHAAIDACAHLRTKTS